MRTLVFILASTLLAPVAYSLQCADVLGPRPEAVVERHALDSEREEALFYLETLMASRYSPQTFRFRVEKSAYRGLEDINLSDADVIRIMVRLLDHNYTYITKGALQEASVTLNRYAEGEKLKSREVIAGALVEFYKDEKDRSQEALFILGESLAQESLWYRAMIHYKRGEFKDSESLLLQIENPSAKTREALAAVQVSREGGPISNRLEETDFDSTQWGAFEELK